MHHAYDSSSEQCERIQEAVDECAGLQEDCSAGCRVECFGRGVRSALDGLCGVTDVLRAQLLRPPEGAPDGMFLRCFAAAVFADAAAVPQQAALPKPSLVVVFSSALLLCDAGQKGTWDVMQVLRITQGFSCGSMKVGGWPSLVVTPAEGGAAIALVHGDDELLLSMCTCPTPSPAAFL